MSDATRSATHDPDAALLEPAPPDVVPPDVLDPPLDAGEELDSAPGSDVDPAAASSVDVFLFVRSRQFANGDASVQFPAGLVYTGDGRETMHFTVCAHPRHSQEHCEKRCITLGG